MEYTFADGSWIRVEDTGVRDYEGRLQFRWTIVGADNRTMQTGTDLRSGCWATPTESKMLGTLASFLTAFAEGLDFEQRTGRESENADLFNSTVAGWVQDNQDELSMVASHEVGS